MSPRDVNAAAWLQVRAATLLLTIGAALLVSGYRLKQRADRATLDERQARVDKDVIEPVTEPPTAED